jgi:hypothetical protein
MFQFVLDKTKEDIMTEFVPMTCPMCGGKMQVKPAENHSQCSYCGTDFIISNRDRPCKTTPLNSILFHHLYEPRERAFELQVPDGWMVEGGIFRVGGAQTAMNAQAIEAKLDFMVKSDPHGRVMLRWGPEIKYTDPRLNPGAILGGMFGGNYAGMRVTPLMNPVEFITRIVFPWAHPHAVNASILHQQDLPVLVENFCKRTAGLGLPVVGQHSGGMVVFSYSEGNLTFRENIYTVIENMGPIAGGMWSNKDTFLERAPQAEFDQWQPIMAHIRDSGKINPAWMTQEMRSQGILAGAFLDAQRQQQQREQQALNLQHELQAMDRQIADHRARTQVENQKSEYLNLMNLEEYLNPYTHEPETGSNQWNYRWVTANGDEFYCDDAFLDPNSAGVINRSDWKVTPARPRTI